jgi:hypothetical protein
MCKEISTCKALLMHFVSAPKSQAMIMAMPLHRNNLQNSICSVGKEMLNAEVGHNLDT